MATSQELTTGTERRFEQLLENAPESIIELDSEGRISRLNLIAQQLFGFTGGELFGQTIELLIPDALHAATRSPSSGLELHGRRKDGSRFPVEISLSPLRSGFGCHGLAIVRDITERTEMENQLRAMQEKYVLELEERKREAEQANQLKTEFLANISHELRSPLHSVIGFADLLHEETEGNLNENQKRFIDHICDDSLHLLDLINDLLDLSKIEAGRLELNHETFHINAVIDETLSSVRPRATAKSVEIRTAVSAITPVFADRMRFKQIMHNLLTNAIKFTPAAGQIQVRAERRGHFAEISVSDTGIGIPKDQHNVIFDKFYQVRSASGTRSEGTGLGLAITKRLVEQHEGKIWLKSEPGHGSCFTFTIPLEKCNEAGAA